MNLTKMERIRLLSQHAEIDRVPYSFWTHFPDTDLDPKRLAEVTYSFYQQFDLDIIKNMPNGLFAVEDWGAKGEFDDILNGGVAKVANNPIQVPEDWEKISIRNINKGAFSRELKSLEFLLQSINKEAPVLATVFSPLTVAYKLSGNLLFEHLKTSPTYVKNALEAIAETMGNFAQAAINRGCAGVFFATQLATKSLLSESEYNEFGVYYDRLVLNKIRKQSWFNVIHIHGNDIMFNLIKDYPVEAVSWHVWETDPTVQMFLDLAPDKCIVGGLQRFDITKARKEELADQIASMIQQTNKKRLLLAPGCVIRAPFASDVLHFIRNEINRKSVTRL